MRRSVRKLKAHLAREREALRAGGHRHAQFPARRLPRLPRRMHRQRPARRNAARPHGAHDAHRHALSVVARCDQSCDEHVRDRRRARSRRPTARRTLMADAHRQRRGRLSAARRCPMRSRNCATRCADRQGRRRAGDPITPRSRATRAAARRSPASTAPRPPARASLNVLVSSHGEAMQRLVRLLAASLLLVATAGACAQTALDDVMAKKVIVIAIPTDFPPYGFVGTDLVPQGPRHRHGQLHRRQARREGRARAGDQRQPHRLSANARRRTS